jgi:Uncharacterized protein conserved in bacteria
VSHQHRATSRAAACAGTAGVFAKLRCMTPRFVDDISARIRALLEQSPAADLEKNLRVLLTGFFNRLDLVTREEYDVQREVLLRTREKLAQLEAKVAELERQLRG